MEAAIDYDMDETDWGELINDLKVDEAVKSTVRDGLTYYLKKEGDKKKIKISVSNIPPKWNRLFDDFYNNLKYVPE